MRTKIIAANWKLNKLPADVEMFFTELAATSWREGVEVVVFPQAALSASVAVQFQRWSEDKGILNWGAQNIYSEKSGAFTGETSIDVIKALGGHWVLIGHSERRTLFGETDSAVNKKVKLTLESGLRPMVCVGETLDERKANQTMQVVERQVVEGLKGHWTDRVAIAYEPVWAIGTGLAATAEQAQEVHKFIRDVVAKTSSQELADSISILYGGSVKPENGASFLSQKDVDGLLVGGASLLAKTFAPLIP
jgi:triosephosphate isomerase